MNQITSQKKSGSSASLGLVTDENTKVNGYNFQFRIAKVCLTDLKSKSFSNGRVMPTATAAHLVDTSIFSHANFARKAHNGKNYLMYSFESTEEVEILAFYVAGDRLIDLFGEERKVARGLVEGGRTLRKMADIVIEYRLL